MSRYLKAELSRAQVIVEKAQADLVSAKAALKNVENELKQRSTAQVSEVSLELEVVRCVLNALLSSLRWRGFDRRRFQSIIAQESRRTPHEGPASVKHTMLLLEARKVLGKSAPVEDRDA